MRSNPLFPWPTGGEGMMPHQQPNGREYCRDYGYVSATGSHFLEKMVREATNENLEPRTENPCPLTAGSPG